MKSRTSCCNAALLRRILTRTALLWGAYLLIWLVGLPGSLLSAGAWETVLQMKQTVLRTAANASHAVSFFYGLAVAWFLFLYLHRSRSTNFFAALPLKRETMFATHYLAGILCGVVPNFLIMGATMLAGSAGGYPLAVESAVWFGANTLGYVFYFSLAVLCAMAVGNLVAMPCLYVILNFVAVVVEATGRMLLQGLLYGFRFARDLRLSPLSPFYQAVMLGDGPDCISEYAEGELISVAFKGWGGLLILAAVGVVLAALAFFLHQRRAMEVAGDVMAIKPLKPVFLYVFTFGCALVGGTILANMLVHEMQSHNFLPISFCVAGCALAGYFLGEMILLKTIRVFRKRNLLRGAICLLVTAAVLVCVRLDVLGVEHYVPDGDAVQGVRLDNARHAVEDPAQIAAVLALHEEILSRRAETEALCREEVWTPSMDITYILKNGKEVSRSYCLPVSEDQAPDPNSLIYKYEEINNAPVFILARQLPDEVMSAANIHNCVIYYSTPENRYTQSIDPSAVEAYELWKNGILRDLQAGNMGTVYQTARTVPMAEDVEAITYSDVYIEYELYGTERTQYYHYSIPETAVHTVALLTEMGVPAEAFAIPNEK